MQTPAGFERHRDGPVTVTARAAYARLVRDAVATAGTLHQWAARQPDALPLPGRGTAYAVTVAAAEHGGPAAEPGRWVVRHYQRGGAIAGWLGDRYLRGGPARPEAELLVSEAARARGIATPRVAAAVVYEDGAFYRGDIATEFIEDAADLAILSLSAAAWPAAARRAAWAAAGELLRHCFERGLIHPDLNLKNILVQRSGEAFVAYVIDLDRARLTTDRASPAEVALMVARFHRSRAKLETRTGRAVERAEIEALGLPDVTAESRG